MRRMDPQTVLVCWERGRVRHPLDRALLLHAIAAPGEDANTLADRPLGERNAALLRLHDALSGDVNQPNASPAFIAAKATAAIARLPAGPAAAMTAARLG